MTYTDQFIYVSLRKKILYLFYYLKIFFLTKENVNIIKEWENSCSNYKSEHHAWFQNKVVMEDLHSNDHIFYFLTPIWLNNWTTLLHALEKIAMLRVLVRDIQLLISSKIVSVGEFYLQLLFMAFTKIWKSYSSSNTKVGSRSKAKASLDNCYLYYEEIVINSTKSIRKLIKHTSKYILRMFIIGNFYFHITFSLKLNKHNYLN